MSKRSIQEQLAEQHLLAERLGEHVGRWVAVEGAEVIASEKTLATLLSALGERSCEGVFCVPEHDRCFFGIADAA